MLEVYGGGAVKVCTMLCEVMVSDGMLFRERNWDFGVCVAGDDGELGCWKYTLMIGKNFAVRGVCLEQRREDFFISFFFFCSP